LSVTCDRSVVFSGTSSFLHKQNWLPRHNWNIVESSVKHHKTKPSNEVWFYVPPGKITVILEVTLWPSPAALLPIHPYTTEFWTLELVRASVPSSDVGLIFSSKYIIKKRIKKRTVQKSNHRNRCSRYQLHTYTCNYTHMHVITHIYMNTHFSGNIAYTGCLTFFMEMLQSTCF
jgi:hypothetical protein